MVMSIQLKNVCRTGLMIRPGPGHDQKGWRVCGHGSRVALLPRHGTLTIARSERTGFVVAWIWKWRQSSDTQFFTWSPSGEVVDVARASHMCSRVETVMGWWELNKGRNLAVAARRCKAGRAFKRFRGHHHPNPLGPRFQRMERTTLSCRKYSSALLPGPLVSCRIRRDDAPPTDSAKRKRPQNVPGGDFVAHWPTGPERWQGS